MSRTECWGLCLCLGLAQACAHEEAQARTWVHRLTLRGQHHFSAHEIVAGLSLQSTGWWPLARKTQFDEGALRVDEKRVVAYCNQHGYFDARVVGAQVAPHGKDAVDVTITIDEGEPTLISGVSLQGLDSVPERPAQKLRQSTPLRAGKSFDYADFVAALAFVRDQLRQQGYAYAQVNGEAKVDRSAHKAAVTLSVSPGPVVHVGVIGVEGNQHIPEDSIRRRLTFEKGDLLDPRELERSENRIYGLGVLSAATIRIPIAPQPTADVTVQVEPTQRLHELRLGGGVGVEQQREEARLRAEWMVHSFLGGLRTLQLTAKPAYVVVPGLTNIRQRGFAADGEAQLVQPDFLNTALTAQCRVGYRLQIQDGFEYYGPRGGVGLERSLWRDRIVLGASWNLQYFTFFDINTAAFNPVTTPLGFGFQNPYRLAYLEEVLELDLRDNRISPHRGVWLGAHVEEGFSQIGSDFRYFKVVPEARAYLPIGRYATVAVRALVGWLDPFSMEHDSPVTRRFFLGGPSGQRGFSYGRLAPQVVDPATGNRIPIGGDGEALFSGELRVGTFRVWGNPLDFVAFVDAGDVTPSLMQLHFNDLHYAVGPDLLYQTPIGPMRAGLGIRLNRLGENSPNGLSNPDPGQRFAFHITLGEAF